MIAFTLSAQGVHADAIAGHSAQLAPKVSKSDTEDSKIQELAIKNVLTRYNSPMAEEADNFMLVANTLELNPYMLPSIAGVESGFGRVLIDGTYNPFGWNVGRTYFYDWSDGIAKVGYALKFKYFERGAEDMHDVGRIYAGGSTTWAPKVLTYMEKFEKEEERIRRIYML